MGRQDECSEQTIRRIAAEDGLHRQDMRRAPPLTPTYRTNRLRWVEENVERNWEDVLWTDEVPLMIAKDPRRKWVTRRVGEEYDEGFTVPAIPQEKHVMAWGVIGYNYKGPLYRFDLNAPTPELQYITRRPTRITAANGINAPKYGSESN